VWFCVPALLFVWFVIPSQESVTERTRGFAILFAMYNKEHYWYPNPHQPLHQRLFDVRCGLGGCRVLLALCCSLCPVRVRSVGLRRMRSARETATELASLCFPT
jgi:hypothetical protein